ncbi:MAG TPA: hypothetical protein VFB79_12370 [Candidatus Angelobacter sp.]|nr:hypothetical protein [Candidatus Angelobacter sp.]
MKYPLGNNYKPQTTSRRINDWTQPAAFPSPVPTLVEYFSGFMRAARQTLSFSSVRNFYRELDATDKVLSRLSWALLLAILVFAAFAFFASGTMATMNSLAVSPWIKPIKFSISFSTYATTISLFLLALHIPEWQLRLVRRMIAATVAMEILSLGAQAWRIAYPPAMPTFIDSVLAQITNNMVMANTAIVVWMFALFCLGRVRTDMVDWPMVAGIRNSLIIFLAGNAIGGYMLARGSHTVGASDGGPGLPFLNWSTIGGDLRIAHFIALHAIQIVPLFAYILAQMEPVLPVKQRKKLAATLAILVALGVSATFIQAALGHPLLTLH